MSLRARVHNGRLVADEPTDLPEGTELDFVLADEGEEPVDLSASELAELDRRLAETTQGHLVPGEVVFSELRSRG